MEHLLLVVIFRTMWHVPLNVHCKKRKEIENGEYKQERREEKGESKSKDERGRKRNQEQAKNLLFLLEKVFNNMRHPTTLIQESFQDTIIIILTFYIHYPLQYPHSRQLYV